MLKVAVGRDMLILANLVNPMEWLIAYEAWTKRHSQDPGINIAIQSKESQLPDLGSCQGRLPRVS